MTTTATTTVNQNNNNYHDDEEVYAALVIDSGPIIRLSGLASLYGRAQKYYTVPAVMQEIRDTKARQHLQTLPFDITLQEPTPEGIQAVTQFARQTGDYPSLSTVDLQVLGLVYDLEKIYCHGNVEHIRTTPKRTLGVGKIQQLNQETNDTTTTTTTTSSADDDALAAAVESHNNATETGGNDKKVEQEEGNGVSFFESQPTPVSDDDDDDDSDKGMNEDAVTATTTTKPKSWAGLVGTVTESTAQLAIDTTTTAAAAAMTNPSLGIQSQNNDGTDELVVEPVVIPEFPNTTDTTTTPNVEGQFSDAEEDDEEEEEEDPQQQQQQQQQEEADMTFNKPSQVEQELMAVEADLQSDFPSLAASVYVPYEGSDDEQDEQDTKKDGIKLDMEKSAAILAKEKAEQKRLQALKPIPKQKSGTMYNSFGKYSDILKQKGIVKTEQKEQVTTPIATMDEDDFVVDSSSNIDTTKSRIMGGSSMAGQGEEVEDDGEGWITCTKDIRKMKSAGVLDPTRNPKDAHDDDKNQRSNALQGPPINQRAACTTTDFAMQNVLLQMNLELLSVDGIKVRKLKSWVTRCGACYTVHTDVDSTTGPNGTKRMFCSRCGSDMMQRIAASVDGKSGRLRLHLSKKYKHNLRGSKFALPKAGTNNKYQGDLLLREDQLLYGAWNQKVKNRSSNTSSSGKTSSCMFGSDLASNVGCRTDSLPRDDLKVGFGRRNPNATKHGREKRGKKKKNTTDKACGLRRY
mmetsp:Transcript_24601/g.34718  ORF Transcript_24601/g.34718 Transcript_24601/m.34718 type:complete len:743 (+) Transcript_24601:123-2351(+)